MVKYSILILSILFFACKNKNQEIATPKEFLNHVVVTRHFYSSDSILLLAELYNKMKKHEESFQNPEYFDSTVLTIDSIIYDPTFKKIAVFVVAQNPTSRNRYSNSKSPYYYNGYCYLGKRNEDTSSMFELKCVCRFAEINFEDRKTVVEALQDDFFFSLATVLDSNKQLVFKYNIDDQRFWESQTGWERMFHK